jgi:cell division transport system ATP-binding protein
LRRRIGVVFQEFRLLDHLTAMDNAALPLGWPGLNRRSTAMMSPSSWPG